MTFCVVGINHQLAPIALRERVHFKETDIIRGTEILVSESTPEVVILSTCNRSEIFFLSTNPSEDLARVEAFYGDFFQVEGVKPYIFQKMSRDALKHLFEVTLGMDSLVLGEDQILGQVRGAHLTAMELGASGKRMNKVFREAITFAKRVKARTHISDHPLSIAYIGVKRIHGQIDLDNKKCMVVGLGEMGRLALEHALERGAKIYACNRTLNNSQKMQERFPAIDILPYDQMLNGLEEMDVLITATASPHKVLNPDQLQPRRKPLYIMDLSMPRDVDAAVGELPGVTLVDIDQLMGEAQENEQEIRGILLGYRDVIEQKLDELQDWDAGAAVDPIMKSLNERCDQIAEDTLNYIYRKTEMTHNQKRKVDKIVRSALKKVLREPLLQLREMEDGDKKRAAIEALEEVLER